jgi:hypothetical protein
MKCGKLSNWVHWSYAVRTGTSTSIVSSKRGIGLLLSRAEHEPAIERGRQRWRSRRET